MKTRFLVNLVVVTLFPVLCLSQTSVHLIADRYKEYLFLMSKPDSQDIKKWITTLNADEHWPDLDYTDINPARWQVAMHLGRVQQLAIVYAKPGSRFYQDKKVAATITSALDLWLKNKFTNVNWWHNEIGIPQIMRDIVICLENWLTSDQMKQALEVINQYRLKGTGANLVWSADIGMHLGAITNNDTLVRFCSQKISDEIKIVKGDGINPDYSFHQHGARLMNFAYGNNYLKDNVRIAWELHGTPWAFPEAKAEILTAYVLNAWQWMSRGINTVPGTLDRSATRVNNLHNPDLRSYIQYLCDLSPAHAADFRALEARQNDRGEALVGYRYYPYSDFAAFHRKEFSFFLKTISTRTLPSESIINENLKGHLLNSGDGYLIRDGSEYLNMMPVWDWNLLPGITYAAGAGDINQMPFVGGVTDSISGLSAMDVCYKNVPAILTAKKIWASHGDIIVCLIAGLTSTGTTGSVMTAMDQCRQQGDVIVNTPGNVLKEGNNAVKDVHWIHHNGFAYIPLQPASMNIKTGSVTGTWTSINQSEIPGVVMDKVFLPAIIHGDNPHNKSAGYVLAYAPTPAIAAAVAKQPKWKVLQNDTTLKAVSFSDGTIMAAFHIGGDLKASKTNLIHADRPCLVMISDSKIFASDPLQVGGELSLGYKNKWYKLLLPQDGTTISMKL
jgi:chondroitin AC lyase